MTALSGICRENFAASGVPKSLQNATKHGQLPGAQRSAGGFPGGVLAAILQTPRAGFEPAKVPLTKRAAVSNGNRGVRGGRGVLFTEPRPSQLTAGGPPFRSCLARDGRRPRLVVHAPGGRTPALIHHERLSGVYAHLGRGVSAQSGKKIARTLDLPRPVSRLAGQRNRRSGHHRPRIGQLVRAREALTRRAA